MNIDESQVADLIARRKAAERVVEEMADGPIKERAFEVAFQYLLAAPSEPVTARRRGAKTKRKGTSEAAPTARAKRSTGPRRHLNDLMDEGFFNDWKGLPDIVQELRLRGHSYKQEELSKPLQRMTQAKILRRQSKEREGARPIYVYRDSAVTRDGPD
jgi:hypothetical protein